jgi:hypothetical protein
MLSSLRTPELFHQMEQFQLPMAWRVCPASSAKRMNINSRGCEPTETQHKTNPTLKGSHQQPSQHAFRIQPMRRKILASLCGPFRADDVGGHVPWVTPTAIHAVRLRRTDKNHIHRVNIFTTHHTYPLARTHGYSCNAPSANLVLQSTTDWKDCPEALRLCAFAPLR